MGFPPLLNLSTRLSTAALPGQTTKTALTEEFMFQNVAYRPTVYRTGADATMYLNRNPILFVFCTGKPLKVGYFNKIENYEIFHYCLKWPGLLTQLKTHMVFSMFPMLGTNL